MKNIYVIFLACFFTINFLIQKGNSQNINAVTEEYQAHYGQAVSAFKREDYSVAIEHFKKALELKPRDTYSGQNLYLCAQKLGDEKMALKYAELLYSWGRAEPFVYLFLAKKAMETKEYYKALQFINKGISVNPKNVELLTMIINVYILSGQEKDALSAINKVLKLTPNNYLLHLNKGLLYRNLGDLKNAEKALNKALQINPNDVNIYKELGGIYYNNALEVKKDLNKLALNSKGEFVDKKVAAKMKKKITKYYKKSVPYCEKFVSNNPKDKETLVLLEYMYFKLGKKEPAQQITKRIDLLE